ncbi:putative chemoreceptor glutamine deamidase [Desulfonema limicola]|uniref:Probable chemoreceptor glutamine deamidase CheD n=1 Tax=Desulfonema limicola TaxID=45656 RepID=A0A975BAD3_9BACT|nr:chemotaxis protein CheD [Desulfonema limicola]QTA81594.1 putative chemoreceptor glutamine deamidase [Desulfonema limicola]
MKGCAKDLSIVFLRPGELFLSNNRASAPVKVTTVLGSCISVILYNPRLKMSAMCHAVMPCCDQEYRCGKEIFLKKTGKCPFNCAEPNRYVNCVLNNMISHFRTQGAAIEETKVRLFGGADMFDYGFERTLKLSVGRQNIEMAKKIIKTEKMHLSKSDVGGLVGRKIVFFPKTGRVLLKRLNSTIKDAIIKASKIR